MTVLDSRFARQSSASITGSGPQTLLCAHGFCSHQGIFRHQVAAFAQSHRVVTYDLAGFGQSDPDLWRAEHHQRLEGYAADMVRLIDELGLRRITLLGASMGAMIGLLASLERPERFSALVFIGASPRYLNDATYQGGFERADVDGFYRLIDGRQDWQGALTGMLLNQPVSLPLQEIAENVRGVRPEVAGVVARAIFDSDYRSLLAQARHPVLVTQTRADSAVPESVARYLHRNLPNAELAFLPGVGHIPNFTEPGAFNAAVRGFPVQAF
ncbi:alpha/beta fold hydrolase [Deinococcus hopiensis]|uniref:Pimeloyl-ACP methyl ester carboxylesterase n=1 Tax=Deinococcus hopiensis KR-140 TaxID=695939 RepID=A0A1W1UQR0_9DEIO|nr:alpha/beta hydrolase [Deinococcus hopiensis]SMB83339.1 Pimeloyl-ACP methyl ester carboxylesterase [Deinococcus hopiensis KR-140]